VGLGASPRSFRSASAHKCLLYRPRCEQHNDRTRTESHGALWRTSSNSANERHNAGLSAEAASVRLMCLICSPKRISTPCAEAHRVLTNGGLLAVVSLTKGVRGLARLVTWTWERLHLFSPILTGGCRPIIIGPLLEKLRWRVRHRNVVTPLAICFRDRSCGEDLNEGNTTLNCSPTAT
jgi:hypothetical protein